MAVADAVVDAAEERGLLVAEVRVPPVVEVRVALEAVAPLVSPAPLQPMSVFPT